MPQTLTVPNLPAVEGERDTERVPPTDPRAGSVSVDPQRRSGVPCFAGTRVPIHDLFDYLAGGEPLGSFLESFPSVSREQAERVLMLAEDRLLDGLSAGGTQPPSAEPRAEWLKTTR